MLTLKGLDEIKSGVNILIEKLKSFKSNIYIYCMYVFKMICKNDIKQYSSSSIFEP